MSKNYLYWIGVRHNDPRVTEKFRYGDYAWMDYSKRTWEYWCKKNDVEFVHYDTPKRDDLIKYKINWQRWLDIFEYIPDDFDSIMLMDASSMVRWDAPNFFDVGEGKLGGVRANENWGWVFKSANGYKDMFPDVNFSYKDYVCSGTIVIRNKHKHMIRAFGEFYLDNHSEILKREDQTVKHGRDQPVLNYFIQAYDTDVHYWTPDLCVNHLYRREILNGNWQIQEDPTPFFIKYYYSWQFSGFSDRGETRTRLMGQTWDLIKHHYA